MRKILDAFRDERIDVAAGTVHQYSVAVAQWARFRGHVTLDETAASDLRDFLRFLASRRSARTVNNKRSAILTLWRWGHEHGLVAIPPPRIVKLREAKRIPTAWTIEEVGRILHACGGADRIEGWTPAHWRALVLTAYDSALRIGCLLDCQRSALDGDTLTVPGEIQKSRVDTRHRLHPETVAAIRAMPPSRLLFPWPCDRRRIWPEFGRILVDAGLPCGRRDKFHRLRRTSYSYVVKGLNVAAATEHAGHAGDLSRFYLDRRILGLPSAIDVLPRPTPNPLPPKG